MMFYKETEFQETTIGKIPKAWKVTEVSSIGEVFTGKTPSTSNKNYWNGKIPFVTPADISETKHVKGTERHVTLEGVEQSSILPKNTVLVVCIGSTIGKIALIDEESVTNQQINSIICNKDTVEPEFIYYSILFRSSLLRSFSGIAAVPIVKKSLFVQFKVPIPPVSEQKAVVEVLDVVDSAIELADKVIAKTERLKKGLMQQLLTRGIGHTEYKETPIGKIPTSWTVVRLGELGELQYGYTTSAVKEDTGISFLRITDIQEDGVVKWEQVPYCNIRENEFEKYALKEGDLLFARIGATAGKTSYINRKVRGIFASYLIRLKMSKKDVHSPFVFYFTQSPMYWSQALRQREGQLKKGINATMLSKFMVPQPTFDEQQRIAEILSEVDRKLDLDRKEKTKLENIKQGLMDLLLTGKVRIKVD